MKRILFILIPALLGACTTVYTPQGDRQIVTTSQHALVNNTPYSLDVFVDGNHVYHRIAPGQVAAIRCGAFTATTLVVATAYDGAGIFRGASSFTYHARHPQAWLVSIRP